MGRKELQKQARQQAKLQGLVDKVFMVRKVSKDGGEYIEYNNPFMRFVRTFLKLARK